MALQVKLVSHLTFETTEVTELNCQQHELAIQYKIQQ